VSNLRLELSERTGQLKALVKENFDRFISCKTCAPARGPNPTLPIYLNPILGVPAMPKMHIGPAWLHLCSVPSSGPSPSTWALPGFWLAYCRQVMRGSLPTCCTLRRPCCSSSTAARSLPTDGALLKSFSLSSTRRARAPLTAASHQHAQHTRVASTMAKRVARARRAARSTTSTCACSSRSAACSAAAARCPRPTWSPSSTRCRSPALTLPI